MGQTSRKTGGALQIRFHGGTRPEFGRSGLPQRWVNVCGRVSGGARPVRTEARLNGGAPAPLGLGPDTARLPGDGEFNVELAVADLRVGLNALEVRAEDSSGVRRSGMVDFLFEPLAAAPPPVLDMTAAECPTIYDFGQPVDGDWYLGEDGARCREMGYDRLLAFGDLSWTDYELLAEVVVHGFHEAHAGYPAAMGPGVGFLSRWTGHHEDGNQPSVEWRPCGVLGWYRYGRDRNDTVRDYRLCMMAGDTSAPGLSGLLCEDTSGFRMVPGVPHFFRMRVKGRARGAARHSLKVWASDAPEPAAWNLESAGLACENSGGSILFVCHHTDASLRRLQVRPS